jgi:peptidoglycan/xylan/chitin deacetylase (PgdA/CDA1 family)
MPHPLVAAEARANLCLHDIAESPDSIYTLPRAYLLAVLDGLRQQGISDRVRVYFDDGYESVTGVVHELRARYPEIELVLALTLDFLGKPGFIGADDVPALHAAGAAISGHGHEHLHMEDLTDEQILFEFTASRDAFAQYGTGEFVLPFGSYDAEVLAVNERHGLFEFVTTVDYGWDRGQSLRPRLMITSKMTPADVIDRLRSPG